MRLVRESAYSMGIRRRLETLAILSLDVWRAMPVLYHISSWTMGRGRMQLSKPLLDTTHTSTERNFYAILLTVLGSDANENGPANRAAVSKRLRHIALL